MTSRQASKVLPQLKDSIQAAPVDLVNIGDQKNCADLVEDIVEFNNKKIEKDPRLKKRLPAGKEGVEKQLKLVNTLWREIMEKTEGRTKRLVARQTQKQRIVWIMNGRETQKRLPNSF